MSVLSSEQQVQYAEAGYLLASGLIPENVAAQAEAAMWRLLEADPADRTTWERLNGTQFKGYDDPALLAVYTPQFIAAAAELAGGDPADYASPRSALAINVFPQQAEWHWPEPHIDHAIKEHGHKTFPRAFRVATMTFLSDVPPHGAGTVVWPGSHRKLETLAKSDVERYDIMWALNQDLERANLGDPVELTPRRGDILFYHYLCAHAGSMNTSDRPRLALNMKW